jgi:prepilin-type N-terminal cleavage/methylation domain-containing protein
MHKQHGFTLIELLVVIAIIALLMGIFPEDALASDAQTYQASSGHLNNSEVYVRLVESLY